VTSRRGRTNRPHTRPGLGVAADWRGAVVRIRAKRTELRSGVDTADHGKRTSLMFAIERRGFRRVELAGRKSGSVLRVVEPEAHIERVRGGQTRVRIEAEDLVEKNSLDADMAVIGALSDFDVRLVPGQTETAIELWISAAVGKERAVLHGEEIECKARLDAVEVENKRVIQFATDDGSLRLRLLVRVGAQTVNDRRIRDQVKGYFVFLVLRRGNATQGYGS